MLLSHIEDKVRENEIFSRERTPTRVLGALMYHAGTSYRGGAEVLGCAHETLRDWYLRLETLFQPRKTTRPVIAVDETKVNVAGRFLYCWAAVDVQTFEIVHLDVSPGRSSLDALLFLRTVVERCRGQPVVLVDRGPWYSWAFDRLECPYRQQTWGTRRLVESLFFLVKYRLGRFWQRFPFRSSVTSTRRWRRAFAAIHNARHLS